MNGVKTDDLGNVIYDQSLEKTPASTGDTLSLPATPLLVASSSFGKLGVRSQLNTSVGGDTYAFSTFTDTLNSASAGTIRFPIVIFGSFSESYSGEYSDVYLEMLFQLNNQTNRESAEAVSRNTISYFAGNRSEAPEIFETPSSPAVLFSALSGNGGFYETYIDLPVVVGDNVVEMVLTSYVQCSPADGGVCVVDADFSKTMYLGPGQLFDENGNPLDFDSNVNTESGLQYSRGTLVDRPVPGEVPEPSTVALVAVGLGLAIWRRRHAA